MENKELVLLEEKVNNALSISQELEISDDKTLVKGIDLLKNIKVVGKAIKQQKEKITKPLNEALKNARAMFKPAELNYTEAEKIVKQKILAYNLKAEEERKIKEEKLAKRVEKGTLKEETAVRKMSEIKEVSNKGTVGSVSMRTRRVVKITDESKIPREYLSLNMVLIRKEALAGKVIPGAIVVEEKSIAGL